MVATNKRNSRILEEIRDTARGLHGAGLVSKRRMGEFEALCRGETREKRATRSRAAPRSSS